LIKRQTGIGRKDQIDNKIGKRERTIKQTEKQIKHRTVKN
jgi:hypothetical protein